MNDDIELKDAFLIWKAIEKIAKKLFDDKTEMFAKQLENKPDKQYRSDYGLLNLKGNAPKTKKVYTKDEQAQVDKLNAQIEKLQTQIDKLGVVITVKNSYNSIVPHPATKAENEAKKQLKTIANELGNKTLINMIEKI